MGQKGNEKGQEMIITPPVRGNDKYGSGAFGAPRGDHTHKGKDYACAKGSIVRAVKGGKVTKIGYPYDPNEFPEKGHLRYVQITDIAGYDTRYFYCLPYDVEIGDQVMKGQHIAQTQGLLDVYPGITDHFHFEVKWQGSHENPDKYLESLE